MRGVQKLIAKVFLDWAKENGYRMVDASGEEAQYEKLLNSWIDGDEEEGS